MIYRGKCIDNGDWVEGWYSQEAFGAWPLRDAITPILDAHAGYLHREEINIDTLGRYTGKDDKNGTKIFEGDLVQAVLPRSKAQNGFVWPLMPVVFREGIFGLLTARDEVVPFTAFAPSVTLEVKGNIHDHPEMLKGEKANEG